jgi:hypothetical protein
VKDMTMRIGLRGCVAALALMAGACFDGEELTEGLMCLQNSHCGGQQLCINGICGEPEAEDEDDTGVDTQGNVDPCASAGNVCVDGNTLGVCNFSDMTTTEVSCDETCESSGFSQSLGCRSSTGSKYQCYCDQLTTQCTDTTCSGAVLLECATSEIEATDCREMCQGIGQAGSCTSNYDTGAYECVCSPGTCYDGETFCQDDDTEIRCVGGVWQPQSCSDAACHMAQCPYEGACAADYQAQTLGCGFNGSGNGCRCTT